MNLSETPMKFLPKKGIYKHGEGIFYPDLNEATSYDWWVFLKPIGPRLVFNQYRYSNTTARHQWLVRRQLDQLGIRPDLYVETPKSLKDPSWIEDASARLLERIEALQLAIDKPRSHHLKNRERALEIMECERKIQEIKKLRRAK